MQPSKPLTQAQAKVKIARFCAYQDRCETEVRTKLHELGLSEEESDSLIDFLIEEKYLDEERFVSNYVSSKFRQKQWGKLKIKAHLRAKRVSESLIEKYILAINEEEYLLVISNLAIKKSAELQNDTELNRKQKIFNYLTQKGFESESVLSLIFKNQ